MTRMKARRSILACLLLPALSVQAADSTPAVSAQGRIEPAGGVLRLAAPYVFSAPQVITELRVKTGDAVKQGQVLAVLDSQPRLQAALDAAQADLKLAESRHALARTRQSAGEVQAAVAAATSAKIDADHAEREFKRSQQLDTQAAVARIELDKWQTEVALRKALHEQKQHAHCALRDTLAAEVATASATVEVAKVAVARATAELACGVMLAPSEGRVLKTLLYAGELAATPVLEMGDTRTMHVIAEVDQADVRQVRLDMPARITSPALAAPLTGKAIHIGQRVSKRDAFNLDPAARSDGRVVEVTVRLDDPAPVAGLTNLEVEVVLGD
jgi:HlyD family secretion protein